LSATPGKLTLFGGPYDLSTPACPTAWFRKQSSRRVTWSTTLDFDPVTTRSEAGTVVYMNYFTYTSIGIRRATDSEKRIIRFRPAKQAVKDVELSTTGPVKLLIKSDDLSYTLGYQESGAKEVWLGDVDIDTMTSDPAVGAAFTGMMFGLYAFGELEPALAPAIFEVCRVPTMKYHASHILRARWFVTDIISKRSASFWYSLSGRQNGVFALRQIAKTSIRSRSEMSTNVLIRPQRGKNTDKNCKRRGDVHRNI
jgi:hypothetical protein